MAKSPFEIELSEEEARELRSRAARYTVPHGEVLRAKVVLLAAEGTTNAEIARRLDCSVRTVSLWRKRFFEERMDGLGDRPLAGRGRAQAVAAPLLDLPDRPGLPGEGGAGARPLPGPIRGQAAASGRVRDLCRRETLDPGARSRPPAAFAVQRFARATGRAHLQAARGAHLPGRARHRPPRRQTATPLRPLRTTKRYRALRPARLAGDEQGALCLRTPRFLDRRQRLLASRPEVGRAARAALAQPRPRPPARARQLAQPNRDLLLDRAAQSPRAQRLPQPRQPRPDPQRVRAPLERDRRALRLALHPRRPRRPARTPRSPRVSAPARRMTKSELTTGSTKVAGHPMRVPHR